MYGYCRLSRDEDKENYASIEEQKRIIQDYATSRNWTISDFYIDDNVSGYTCLTLEMAYLNARLLARPTAKWLLDLVE